MPSIITEPSRHFFALFTFAFLLFIPSIISAQSSRSEILLRGRVADAADAALSGASVRLSNLSSALERVVIADIGGSFVFTTLITSEWASEGK